MEKDYRTYIGDGVYANYDGYHIIIDSSDGIEVKNRIYLDWHVSNNLIDFIEKIRKEIIARQK